MKTIPTSNKEERNEGSNKIIPGSIESAPTTYVDGLATLTTGPAMSRLHFFQTESIDRTGPTPVEHRKIVHTLVLPTGVLIELASNVLKGMAQNRAALLEGYDSNRAILTTLLDQVSLPQSPKSP